MTRPVVFVGGPLDGRSIPALPGAAPIWVGNLTVSNDGPGVNYSYCEKRSNPLADYYVADGYVEPSVAKLMDACGVTAEEAEKIIEVAGKKIDEYYGGCQP